MIDKPKSSAIIRALSGKEVLEPLAEDGPSPNQLGDKEILAICKKLEELVGFDLNGLAILNVRLPL